VKIAMKKQELLAHSLKRQSKIKFFADQTQCNADGFTVTIQKGKILFSVKLM